MCDGGVVDLFNVIYHTSMFAQQTYRSPQGEYRAAWQHIVTHRRYIVFA